MFDFLPSPSSCSLVFFEWLLDPVLGCQLYSLGVMGDVCVLHVTLGQLPGR